MSSITVSTNVFSDIQQELENIKKTLDQLPNGAAQHLTVRDRIVLLSSELDKWKMASGMCDINRMINVWGSDIRIEYFYGTPIPNVYNRDWLGHVDARDPIVREFMQYMKITTYTRKQFINIMKIVHATKNTFTGERMAAKVMESDSWEEHKFEIFTLRRVQPYTIDIMLDIVLRDTRVSDMAKLKNLELLNWLNNRQLINIIENLIRNGAVNTDNIAAVNIPVVTTTANTTTADITANTITAPVSVPVSRVKKVHVNYADMVRLNTSLGSE